MSVDHNAYCEIECEGEKYNTSVCKDSVAPEWEEAFLFYRIKPDNPITIRVCLIELWINF